jgi:hypothetical protein
MECCHNDSDPTNNAATNLRWDTRAGNVSDMVANGTHNHGERHPFAKLSDQAVREIMASELNSRQAGLVFGVHPSTIRNVRTGRAWCHAVKEARNA